MVRRFWSMVSMSPMRQYSFSLLNSTKLIEYVRPWLSLDHEHLDFGAGDGDFVRAMLNEGYSCGAYEVSPGRSSQYVSLEEFPNFLGVVNKDNGRQFDVVFMLDVVEHILKEEIADTVNLLKGFLKPGGTIIVSTPNNENLDEGYCICPKCEHSFHRWQHMRSYSERSLELEFAAYGFERIASRKVDFSDNVILHDRLRRLEREVSAYKAVFSSGWIKRIYYALFGVSGVKEEVEDTNAGEGITVGNESHLIYVGRRVD